MIHVGPKHESHSHSHNHMPSTPLHNTKDWERYASSLFNFNLQILAHKLLLNFLHNYWWNCEILIIQSNGNQMAGFLPIIRIFYGCFSSLYNYSLPRKSSATWEKVSCFFSSFYSFRNPESLACMFSVFHAIFSCLAFGFKVNGCIFNGFCFFFF